MRTKLGEKVKKRYYSILTLFFVFSTICLFTNLLSGYKQFLVGSFGLVIYPIMILSLCICITKLMNKNFSLDKRSLLYCVLIFISFLGVLQMALTRNFDFSSFSAYITDVYYSQISAGGVVIGTLIFPLRYLLHEIATYVILCVALVILVACAIDNYYYKMAKVRRSKKSQATDYFMLNDDKSKEGFQEQLQDIDFAPLDEKSTLTQNEIKEYEEQSQKAKEILGLNQSEILKNKSNAYEVLYGNENARRRAISTLYPESESRKGTTSEDYLHSNLEKYMPEDKKMHKSLDCNISNNADIECSKIEKDFSQSIEYINRSLPKNTHMGTIIRGDFYNDRDNAVEKVGEEQNFAQDYILQDIGDWGSKYENDFSEIDTINQEELNFRDAMKYGVNVDAQSLIEERPIVQSMDLEGVQDFSNIPNSEDNCVSNFKTFEKNKDSISTNVSEDAFGMGIQRDSQENKSVKKHKKYMRPPISLLTVESTDMSDIQASTVYKSEVLESTLSSFKIPAKVNNVIVGPSVTMYEMSMPMGISVKKVNSYADDIAMSLASKGSIRIQAPIPGKNAVGIEVPNDKAAVVGFKEVFENGDFDKNSSPLSFVLGKDLYGNYKFCNLAKAPHILIAGSTGSGKSVCLNILILSLIFKCSPDDVRLILIDPKRVEFAIYEGLPHLMLPSIITEPEKAVNAFSWAVSEMEKRYRTLQILKIRDIGEYNNLEEVKNGQKEKMPYIVIIVDELADLMSVAKKDIEDKIQRLTAKARSAGIHLVIATQRPSIDVVTGTIKNNLPVRIAFSLASFSDSKTVLDQSGAEKLLGKGDMLYLAQDTPEPMRFQSPLVKTEEIKDILEYVKQNNETNYEDGIESIMLQSQENHMEQASKPVVAMKNVAEDDDLFKYALKIVVETRQASASLLQRRLRLGWNRAGSLIDAMQKMGYISPPENNKRQVLISMEQFKEIYGEVEDL